MGRVKTAGEWVAAYQNGDAKVADFYAGQCWEWDANLHESNPLGNTDLAEWRALVGDNAPPAVYASFEKLAQPKALTVVTGQQAGVALGPIYTIFKALAAKHWAAEVERETGRPCVPVFWIASDDHDLAEAAEVSWLGADAALRRASLAGTASARPVYTQEPNAQLTDAWLRELEESLPTSEFRAELIDDLKASANAGSYEDGFKQLFLKWLGPLGIVPVAPRLGFMRRAAAPVIRHEIETAPLSSELARRAGEQLQAAGVAPPLHRAADDVNVFLDVDGIRGKVTVAGDQFTIGEPGTGRRLGVYTRAELLDTLAREPERFSPSAILRPIVQDHVLPNIAYIPGPTEFVYHAQAGPLYPEFGVPRPALLPRPNVALITPKVLRALGKLAIEPDELNLESQGATEALLNQRAPKTESYQRFEMEAELLASQLAALKAVVDSIGNDTAIQQTAQKLERMTSTGIEKLSSRVRHFTDAQDTVRAMARERVMAELFPGGTPQERAISVLTYICLYGPDLPARMFDAIDFMKDGWQALRLAEL